MSSNNRKKTNDMDESLSGSSYASSSSSSADMAELGQAGSSCEKQKSFEEHQKSRLVTFWGNFLLSACLVIGALVSIGAYLCLNNLEDLEERTGGRITKDNLAVIFTTVNALGFFNLAILILAYTKYIQRLTEPVRYEFHAAWSNAMIRTLFPTSGVYTTSTTTSKTLLNVKATTTTTTGEDRTAEESSSNNAKGILDFLDTARTESALVASYANATSRRAELFTDTTIMFADIEGFTAWSSTREPSQVFVLLETLFASFDECAARRKVFKVETVGDCYMAVCGLPEPRKDHAVVMARFSRDILKKMKTLVKKLEIELGPDTADLRIRIGLHSGACTAGILKGERRLQLFGDSVNVASRIESTGTGNQIHLSHHTRELLEKAGKAHWCTVRPTKVCAKGKGKLDTYWLNLQSSGPQSSVCDSQSDNEENSEAESEDPVHTTTSPNTDTLAIQQPNYAPRTTSAKVERLVQWNCDILRRLLKEIVARRQCLEHANPGRKADADETVFMKDKGSLVEEVKETISMPAFDYSRLAAEQAESMELDPTVDAQLVSFVRQVANMYSNDNPFHNFKHASHVTMSVAKLLSRITAPTSRDMTQSIHDHTYGITSDPLTQFSCVLSALIHDADHQGVPNAQLVKEETDQAKLFNNQSVAEQNSLHVAWDLLMSSQFDELRKTIYTTQAGLKRFRSLVVNSVLATDICDKELKQLRNNRWEKAFSNDNDNDDTATKDRKATIVIEHLIQASDVAHTMQHWHIYRKWNEKLFFECYKAFKQGRAEKNPIEYWYQGEIGFFDFYIIPLAKKLKECGVFGVSSDEYLQYALRNREEWEARGHTVVEELIAKVQAMEEQTEMPAEEINADNLPVVARTA